MDPVVWKNTIDALNKRYNDPVKLAAFYEEQKRKVEEENAKVGNVVDGIECEECKNRGYLYILNDSRKAERIDCPVCTPTRKLIEKIRDTGLENQLTRFTFDSFTATEEYQIRALTVAKEYADKGLDSGYWLYAGGQSGSGKTHLCMAVLGNAIVRHNILYVIWPQTAQTLKALVNDECAYREEIEKIQNADVLYIDDFYKPEATKADIKLAFTILNYRYNANLPTMISSEYYLSEIVKFDEAITSRIIEKCRKYQIVNKRDPARNYRLKFMEPI